MKLPVASMKARAEVVVLEAGVEMVRPLKKRAQIATSNASIVTRLAMWPNIVHLRVTIIST